MKYMKSSMTGTGVWGHECKVGQSGGGGCTCLPGSTHTAPPLLSASSPVQYPVVTAQEALAPARDCDRAGASHLTATCDMVDYWHTHAY